MAPRNHDSISDSQVDIAPSGDIGAMHLLTTKLYRPPVTPDLEQRTRLVEHLERKRHRPLTLISAPAGYGKTMLASMWLPMQKAMSPQAAPWLPAVLAILVTTASSLNQGVWVVAVYNPPTLLGSLASAGKPPFGRFKNPIT